MKIFSLIVVLLWSISITVKGQQHTLYVAPKADKEGTGTRNQPLSSIQQALYKIRQDVKTASNASYQIILQDGIHFLDSTVRITSEDFRDVPIRIQAQHEGKAIVSAGKPLHIKWQRENENIWKGTVPSYINDIPVLYIDNQALIRARYPNYQSEILPFGGYSENALSKERIRSWQHPSGAYLHALHQGRWGGMHFEITEKIGQDSLTLSGGWQNNRPSPPHSLYRFVENVREELDAPGEWFFDKNIKTLYYYPQADEHIEELTFVAGHLESCFHIAGTASNTIKNIEIDGLVFWHTIPTFMKTKEPLLRSDWSIYRQGAIFMENAENITISNNIFQALGGNAVFISGNNRHIHIWHNLIEHIGASAILFVGQAGALYNPIFNYGDTIALAQIHREAGAKAPLFPEDCLAEGNLIRHIGQIEKQSAGIQIQVASRISVLHNTIHNVPRAGINIGDGAFGGHLLANNDVFNTVLETSDHGAFNSWGRDRFWRANRQSMNQLVKVHPELILLDAYQTTVIRNNRFHCEHGWDIDLDDGSSNYSIHDNLCLSGGIKLREGFHRKVYQNLLVNNTIHPHVWFEDSHDTVQNNIVMTAFNPVQVADYGTEVDNNIFTSQQQLSANQKLGIDAHGIFAEIEFASPENLDFTIKNITQLEGKFKNLDMKNYGVIKPALKALASSPPVPQIISYNQQRMDEIIPWHSYQLKTVTTLGEQSATGLPEIKGVLVVAKDNAKGDDAFKLMVNDVILFYDNEPIDNIADLLSAQSKHRWKERHQLKIWRDQAEHTLKNR